MKKIDYNSLIYSVCLGGAGVYLLAQFLPEMNSITWFRLLLFAGTILLFLLLQNKYLSSDHFVYHIILITPYLLTHGFSGIWAEALAITGYALITGRLFRNAVLLISLCVLSAWGATTVFIEAGGKFGNLLAGQEFIPIVSFVVAGAVFAFISDYIYKYLVAEESIYRPPFIKTEIFRTLIVSASTIASTILYQNSGIMGIVVAALVMSIACLIIGLNKSADYKYVKTIETFLTVTENKIPQFRGHSERVVKFCQLMLNRLPLNSEERLNIEYAASLHDIGKLGMPEKLLRIHSYLTSEEVQQLEEHPKVGRKLVQQIGGLNQVAELIFCHHEKFDGTGYPGNLSGSAIPLGARVIAVADRFDNLINRVGLRFDQACTELNNLAGDDLDPELVQLLLDSLLAENGTADFVESFNIYERLEHESHGLVEQLRYYLDKSKVLSAFRISYILIYENGNVKGLEDAKVPEHIVHYIDQYIKNTPLIGSGHKEFIADPVTGKIYDAYFIHSSESSYIVTVFDMTEVLKMEKETEEREYKIYRDVILAVTQGKLHLTFGDEIHNFIDEGKIFGEMNIRHAQDVAVARSMVRSTLETLPLSSQRKAQTVLCVSEAVTNVVKHVGEGKIGIYLLDESIRIVIRDNGPGIDMSQLPQVTLKKGYSTKLSLGYGFSIMIDYLDRLIMSTKGGTTLILEMRYDTGSKAFDKAADGHKVVLHNAN